MVTRRPSIDLGLSFALTLGLALASPACGDDGGGADPDAALGDGSSPGDGTSGDAPSETDAGGDQGSADPGADGEVELVCGATEAGEWLEARPLPEARQGHVMLWADPYVYVMGGATGKDVRDVVWLATLEEGGTLSEWTEVEPLPGPLENHGVVHDNGRVWLIGGDNTFGASASVYTTRLRTAGGFEEWVPVTPLPLQRFSHATLLADGHIWSIGGDNALNKQGDPRVFSSPIGDDGELGVWEPREELPQGRKFMAAVAHGGKLWAIGGFGQFGIKNEVWAAELNGDGTTGPWTEVGTVDRNISSHALLAIEGGGFLLVGGWDAVTAWDAVQAVDLDASAPAFLDRPALPEPRFRHAATPAGGWALVSGGWQDAAFQKPPTTQVLIARTCR